jgi:hypothetical protein
MISILYRPKAESISHPPSVGRYFFLLICSFAFCFQQTVGLLYSNTKTWEGHEASQVRKNLNPSAHGLSTAVSLHAFMAAEQLELSEDDDPTHVQPLTHATSRELMQWELAFAQGIRTGYMQQAQAVMQINGLPLFMLHHQWKSFSV